MAYTKIHAVTTAVHKAVSYICNPDKTDHNILISSFGCSPETAAYDFKFALSKTRLSDPNKAFHLIQAFMPGEVSYEEAHNIGVELADKLLEGKYSYIVSTHIDKGHVHNHIIFCAADNIEHQKYHDCKQTYYNIRRLSDTLCKEHGLSVIQADEKRGKKYNEWQADKSGSSLKTALCRDIDAAIKSASTYEEFILFMQEKGYEVKGEQLGEAAPKYIAFRPLERERFIRGSVKTLSADYTKEKIQERIAKKALEQSENRDPFPVRKKPLLKDHASQKLIDTSKEKFTRSPGLKHWADIQNLKTAARIYNEAGSLADMKKNIESKSTLGQTTRQDLKAIEQRLKKLGEIIKYAEQYETNHIYQIRYQKSKDKDRYMRQHESQLLLHDGAEHMLKQLGITPQDINLDKLKSEYKTLVSQKEELQKNYKTLEKEIRELQGKQNSLKQYLNQNIAYKKDNSLH